jgi:hypothetical protein
VECGYYDFQNPPYIASRQLVITQIATAGSSFSTPPCQVWHDYMVISAHRVKVDVGADMLAREPPSTAAAAAPPAGVVPHPQGPLAPARLESTWLPRARRRHPLERRKKDDPQLSNTPSGPIPNKHPALSNWHLVTHKRRQLSQSQYSHAPSDEDTKLLLALRAALRLATSETRLLMQHGYATLQVVEDAPLCHASGKMHGHYPCPSSCISCPTW